VIISFDNAGAISYNESEKGSEEGGARMANQVGKRYRCTKCGAEMIVTKGGEGTITCCGQPMEQK
jgi:desulfoferrodoxin-like iron-binding protein